MTEEAAPAIPGPPHSAFVQTAIAAVRRSLDYPDRFGRRHGDIVQVRLLVPRRPEEPGRWPLTRATVVLVSSPELLQELFARSGTALAGGAVRQFAEWFVGADSIVVLDGKRHLDERAALLTLATPERLARTEAMAREVTAETLARLPSRGRLRLAPVLDEVIHEVSVRVMFGHVDEDTARRFRRAIGHGLTEGWDWPFLLLPWLRRDLGPLSPGGRVAARMAEIRALVADQVNRARAGRGDPESWLVQLLALEGGPRDDDATVDRRVSRVFTVLNGLDTVAVALRWCLRDLFDHPEALARARDETRAGAASYLDAVCKETARLHPAIPVLARLVTTPTALGPYRLEPGTYVVGCIYLTHRRPDLYPEPYRFRPERFLERTFSASEYVPFGGGVRRCLGHGLTFPLLRVVLGELLRTFDLDVRGRRPALRVRRRAVMMVPTDPLSAVVRRAVLTSGIGAP